MEPQIGVKDWLFPEGGVWIIYSKDDGRPCRASCNPDNPDESELGIMCFTSKDLASHFLETVYQRQHIDPSRYPIRYINTGALRTWLEETKEWALCLTWHMRHQEEKAIIHVSVPIADLLFDDDAP